MLIVSTSSPVVMNPLLGPRFLDRAIVCAQGAPITIVLNKNDLPMKEEQLERFMLYEELGYETMSINAFNEKDIASLSERLKGTISAFIGQSGVGKSTLTNHLIGGEVEQKVGDISTKYNRGRPHDKLCSDVGRGRIYPRRYPRNERVISPSHR
ncbi:MAG: GTPase RsgA [Sphaerochaetaceae bacterium]